MGCWTEVDFNIKYPKENISNIVKEVLDKYKYAETSYTSFYSKNTGVDISIRSTLSINLMLPLLNEIKHKINGHCFMTIITYLE